MEAGLSRHPALAMVMSLSLPCLLAVLAGLLCWLAGGLTTRTVCVCAGSRCRQAVFVLGINID